MEQTKAPSMTDEQVSGIYGKLTITYRRLAQTATVEVYQGNKRINALCQTFHTPEAAWAEARRIATAAFAGQSAAQIALTSFSNQLAELTADPPCLEDVVPAEPIRAVPRAAGAVVRTSDPLDRILVEAYRCGGTISRAVDCKSTQILALHHRNLMTPTRVREGRVWRIVAGTLTPAGVVRAEKLIAADESKAGAR